MIHIWINTENITLETKDLDLFDSNIDITMFCSQRSEAIDPYILSELSKRNLKYSFDCIDAGDTAENSLDFYIIASLALLENANPEDMYLVVNTNPGYMRILQFIAKKKGLKIRYATSLTPRKTKDLLRFKKQAPAIQDINELIDCITVTDVNDYI